MEQRDTDGQVRPVTIPALREDRRAFPNRLREDGIEEIDANGDAIFRFSLTSAAREQKISLDEYYRQQLWDLLGVIRLFHRGKPVIIDSFAFLNTLGRQIKLLPPVEDEA